MIFSGIRAIFVSLVLTTSALHAVSVEKQLTQAATGHVLTNVNVWSADSRWIVYDLRTSDTFDGTRIEQVNAETGAVQVLYTSKNGAACGVVTYSPTGPRVVFIHGPDNPTVDWAYSFIHRRGAIVDTRKPGTSHPLDAENYAPPFTRGALRGGSHVHVFSPDGRWVSFTYEDAILAALGDSAGHDLNQRNVGVSVPAGPVKVPSTHPRNNSGDFFTVLVTRTVNQPRPGSDEISRAFEEGWIGRDGYLRADGTRQAKALAFQGNVVGRDGRAHAEVFVVDLPGNLTRDGDGPLAGTETRRPAPPAGLAQRRLTFTDERKFPGVAQAPRHWLRSSPDGARIAFLMQDEAGVVQLWTVAPTGGAAKQLTHNATPIASTFTWSPDGRKIAHVMDHSVFTTDTETGVSTRLTERREDADAPEALACVFSPDGEHIAFTRKIRTPTGEFAQIFTVDVPRS